MKGAAGAAWVGGVAVVLPDKQTGTDADREEEAAASFAVAALFWLLILLGLGGMDPLTRTEYHVSQSLQK